MRKNGHKEILETLSVLALFFLVLFIFFKISWAVYVSLFLLVLSLFRNPLSRFITSLWFHFSEILGKISTLIILHTLFYTIITPLALLWRLFNRKEAGHFLLNENKSLFEDVNRDFSQDYFKKTW